MAAPTYSTTTYPASHFVESAGCIIFHLSSARICLIKHLDRNHWLLPKGRRNLHESRTAAALREVQEETGYACRLLPVSMRTRCPPANEAESEVFVPDLPRDEDDITEPFMLMVRDTTAVTSTKPDVFGDEQTVKLIWWYVASYDGPVDHTSRSPAPQAEEGFNVEWVAYDDAVQRLSFETDREVVRRAIDVVSNSHAGSTG